MAVEGAVLGPPGWIEGHKVGFGILHSQQCRWRCPVGALCWKGVLGWLPLVLEADRDNGEAVCAGSRDVPPGKGPLRVSLSSSGGPPLLPKKTEEKTTITRGGVAMRIDGARALPCWELL